MWATRGVGWTELESDNTVQYLTILARASVVGVLWYGGVRLRWPSLRTCTSAHTRGACVLSQHRLSLLQVQEDFGLRALHWSADPSRLGHRTRRLKFRWVCLQLAVVSAVARLCE